jgi:aquaporin Z
MAMIYSFGNSSGAHFNPAVTIAFWAAKLLPKKEVLPYIVSQTAGAFLATFTLKILFPENINLGSTIPAGTALQSFILEVILTFILMLVILSTSQGSKELGIMAGLAIGATVLLEAMFAGPICGASMNPARSLAPAILSGNIHTLWIYLSAPVIGAILSVMVWQTQRN